MKRPDELFEEYHDERAPDREKAHEWRIARAVIAALMFIALIVFWSWVLSGGILDALRRLAS